MANTSNTAILILAAGESRRLGRAKQLIQIDGETLIHRIARQAAASTAAEILIVLGHQADTIERELTGLQNVRTRHNPDYARGMGTSIRAGVQALSHHQAILISVCDQPHLTTEIFNKLIARLPHAPGGIVCSRYAGSTDDSLPTVHGVPAIFAAKHFPALVALPDEAGAKCLITAHEVDSIDFPNGHIDIDTPDDLRNP